MRWYGLKTVVSRDTAIQALKKKKNFNSKKYLTWKPSTVNLTPKNLIMHIPHNWCVFLLKNKEKKPYSAKHIIYFFNPFYFFSYPLNLTFCNWNFSKFPQTFIVNFVYSSNYTKTFWSKLNLIFHSFTKIFFKKLKFKGKGYYIYKNKRNTIALQFNYSHIKRLYFYFTHIKFLTKTSLVLFGLDPQTLSLAANRFKKTRSINIFTGKGVRLTKQIIYRKTGKVSSYR